MNDETVRDYLRERGCAKHVVEGGLQGLVTSWERIATDVSGGYDLGLEDWLNDLDCRQLLADALPHANPEVAQSFTAAIAAADARFREATLPSDDCIWGNVNASQYEWNAETNWW